MRYVMITSMLAIAAAAPASAGERGDPFERQQAARDIIRNAGPSYLDRSLDKTIVVRRGRAYTVPAPQGQGTRNIFLPREKPPQRR